MSRLRLGPMLTFWLWDIKFLCYIHYRESFVYCRRQPGEYNSFRRCNHMLKE